MLPASIVTREVCFPAEGSVRWGLLPLSTTEDVEECATRVLTNGELSAWRELSHPARRKEWLFARWCLKSLARTDLGIDDARDCEIRKDERGRPHLAQQCGMSTARWECSLSHDRRFAAAGLSTTPGMRIGVDVETVNPRLERICELFVTAGDVSCMARDRREQLAIWWTVKEAASKVVGLGLGAGLAGFECVEVRPGWHQVVWNQRLRLTARHELLDGNVLAVCVGRGDHHPEWDRS